MRAKEFLKEYKTRERINEAKNKALAEVKKVDDQYWSDKPKALRLKYQKANRLPMDHPFVIQYQQQTGRKLKNDFVPI